MGFRFRRSIKILPGIRLNIGKRGVSTSIGGRGAHITIGKRGTRATLSAPGTGISYSTTSRPHHAAAKPPGAARQTPHAEVPSPGRPPSVAGSLARLALFAGMLAIAGRVVWSAIH